MTLCVNNVSRRHNARQYTLRFKNFTRAQSENEDTKPLRLIASVAVPVKIFEESLSQSVFESYRQRYGSHETCSPFRDSLWLLKDSTSCLSERRGFVVGSIHVFAFLSPCLRRSLRVLRIVSPLCLEKKPKMGLSLS